VRFNTLMLENGVLKGENKMYVSYAHTSADVDETLAAIERSLAQL
jgi:glutamate-1-semialdehyde aminotransferase